LKLPAFSEFSSAIKNKGFFLAKNCMNAKFCDELRVEVMKAQEYESGEYQSEDMLGRILFAPIYGGKFLETLELEPLFEMVDQLLGWDSIVYTMTSSCLPPNGKNYTSQIHSDTHLDVGGLIPSIGVQILLDDFTTANGAPEFCPLDKAIEQPDEEQFKVEAKKILGTKGSILFFDTRCWHRSTKNSSSEWRCCLLIALVRNWMKQRFDVPEMMQGVDVSGCSEQALKRLGLPSHPPGSAEEFLYGRQRF
jgi:hypothetical protein